MNAESTYAIPQRRNRISKFCRRSINSVRRALPNHRALEAVGLAFLGAALASLFIR